MAFAANASELRTLYADREDLARYPSLIQERVPGAGVGVFALCDRKHRPTNFLQIAFKEVIHACRSAEVHSTSADRQYVFHKSRLVNQRMASASAARPYSTA